MNVHITTYEKNQLEELINVCSDAIDKLDFEIVYARASDICNSDLVSKLYSIFLEEGINVLDHMTSIPNGFLYMDLDVKEIKIPANIKKIHAGAFTSSSLCRVIIDNPDIIIEDNAFLWCDQIYNVNYNGTFDQLEKNDIARKFTWFSIQKLIINCSDISKEYDLRKKW